MSLKLINILKEEITEQGYGHYFKDWKTSDGKKVGDTRGFDFTTNKPFDKDYKNPEVKVLPSSEEEGYDGDFSNSDFKIEGDLSGLSKYRKKGTPLKENKYFVLHHTGGRGTAEQVVDILNNRETGPLGIQWIIDREGKIYRGLPKDSVGSHIRTSGKMKNGTPYRKAGMPSDMQNNNTQGVEIVGKNDSDILLSQCFSALKLVKHLGYSQGQIFTHGEINSHKMPDEGQKCKTFISENWGLSYSDISKKYGYDSSKESSDDKNKDIKIETLKGGKTVVFGGMDYATPEWMKSQWVSAGLNVDDAVFLPYTSTDLSKVKKDNNIDKIVGFSAGGSDVWDEIISNSSDYVFIGLIDPSTSKSQFDKYKDGGLPSQVKSLCNSSNWDYYPKIQERLKKLEDKNILTKTSSEHKDIPLEFFKKYKTNLS